MKVVVRSFFKRRLFERLLRAYQRTEGLEGILLLHAHGNTEGNSWIYEDEGKTYPMQSFISSHDGDKAALLLQSCNPADYAITSEQSIVIHPRDSIFIGDLIAGGHLRIFVPGEGYLEDNYYQLKKAIRKYSVAVTHPPSQSAEPACLQQALSP